MTPPTTDPTVVKLAGLPLDQSNNLVDTASAAGGTTLRLPRGAYEFTFTAVVR